MKTNNKINILKKDLNYRFCVAPMLHYTDECCRYFFRLLTKKTILFTEMIPANKIIYSPYPILKINNPKNDKIVVQIAGSNTQKLAQSSKIIILNNYKNINLNLGCPSISAQKGQFGACLMNDPIKVIDSIKSIEDVIQNPISIKIRTGIDNNNTYQFLQNFTNLISKNTHCKTFFIHARTAILKNFSPKQNQNIPPLKYEYVYQLKKDFPQLNIIINGGIHSIKESLEHLKKIDGVMLGRKIYQNPLILLQIDKKIFQYNEKKNNIQKIINQYIHYYINQKYTIKKIVRPLFNVFYSSKNANIWKKTLHNFIIKKKINMHQVNEILDTANSMN
ncbi:tRNA dihydrouridine(20/20a) synthase DusA [Buchnera aphidicola (Thelaxes californica)]|uniref:tRNA-dihydrouridine synthase n=1 Tax=Buchnera aphidicola (Thelaxes californica) TaxID=1315998 RepID=A0A4D6YP71_9GAMM|nr:tRNA dihydrouridine(20/20a) synthase DusA [Buchnera aphidicola]QCI26945.1 tRNA dihydrouridine(20/20a) synthase DusA [Buchnera aphidicola (Thelaxes californica)]